MTVEEALDWSKDVGGDLISMSDEECIKVLAAEVKRLQSSEWSQKSVEMRLDEAVRVAASRCAEIVEAECKRVLATQTGKTTQIDMAIDQQLRMVCVLLPDIADAIRKEFKL